MERVVGDSLGGVRRVFIGPEGLRAGWCLLIFFLILAVPAVPIQIIAKHHHVQQPKIVTPLLLGAGEVATIAVVLAVTAIMAWIEGRPFLSYGLRGRRPGARFLAGAVAGLVSLSLVALLLDAGGFLVVDGVALSLPAALRYGGLWLAVFFLVALAEELTFRGYLQTTLARGIGYWPAAVVLSAVFTVAHTANHGESPLGLAGVFSAGLVFCMLLRVGGSVWPGVGFHMTWDWAQSYLYGVPDSAMVMEGHLLTTHPAGNAALSGGSAGPEGSLVALLLLALLGASGRLFISEKKHQKTFVR